MCHTCNILQITSNRNSNQHKDLIISSADICISHITARLVPCLYKNYQKTSAQGKISNFKTNKVAKYSLETSLRLYKWLAQLCQMKSIYYLHCFIQRFIMVYYFNNEIQLINCQIIFHVLFENVSAYFSISFLEQQKYSNV